MKALDVLVRVLLALDRVEDAAEWARRAPAECGGRRTGVFGAIIAHAQAGVLLAQGDAPSATRVARNGAALAEEGLAPLWAGRCRTLAGEALAATGRRADARVELRRASADLEARGAWGHRDAALRALRRLGDRPRPPAATAGAQAALYGLEALSRREQEVAALVAEGLTNAQIAARLFVTESTVEKHVSSVLGKLGEHSRAGVVRRLAGERAAPD
jgi:DNA-binding CsgD family transcriptional regulator